MIPTAAQEVCRERGPGDRCGGAPNDEEDPVSSHTRAPHHCLSLGHHTNTDTSCVHLISAIQNHGPQGGLFFLHPGDGMTRGRVSSSVGRGLIKEKETRVSFFTTESHMLKTLQGNSEHSELPTQRTQLYIITKSQNTSPCFLAQRDHFKTEDHRVAHPAGKHSGSGVPSPTILHQLDTSVKHLFCRKSDPKDLTWGGSLFTDQHPNSPRSKDTW